MSQQSVAAMLWCGDVECDCWMPVIWDANGKEIWRGTFVEKPHPNIKKALREQLDSKARELGAIVVPDVTLPNHPQPGESGGSITSPSGGGERSE